MKGAAGKVPRAARAGHIWLIGVMGAPLGYFISPPDRRMADAREAYQAENVDLSRRKRPSLPRQISATIRVETGASGRTSEIIFYRLLATPAERRQAIARRIF
jgi:hypothetical protein